MARTREEANAYQRGYSAGLNGKWPMHKPPRPPDELCAALIEAARELRDAIDGELAKFDPDDELELAVGSKIDALDAQLTRITEWLLTPAPSP